LLQPTDVRAQRGKRLVTWAVLVPLVMSADVLKDSWSALSTGTKMTVLMTVDISFAGISDSLGTLCEGKRIVGAVEEIRTVVKIGLPRVTCRRI